MNGREGVWDTNSVDGMEFGKRENSENPYSVHPSIIVPETRIRTLTAVSTTYCSRQLRFRDSNSMII